MGSTPFSQVISERCTRPSATPTSTNRPYEVTPTTTPARTSPTASCAVPRALRSRRSCCAAAFSDRMRRSRLRSASSTRTCRCLPTSAFTDSGTPCSRVSIAPMETSCESGTNPRKPDVDDDAATVRLEYRPHRSPRRSSASLPAPPIAFGSRARRSERTIAAVRGLGLRDDGDDVLADLQLLGARPR